jgi:hypothetical protein
MADTSPRVPVKEASSSFCLSINLSTCSVLKASENFSIFCRTSSDESAKSLNALEAFV